MPPPLRTDIGVLREDDRKAAQLEYNDVKLKKFYEVASRKFNPRLFRALDAVQVKDEHLIPSIFDLVGRSWTDGPIPLQHLLIQIVQNWESLTEARTLRAQFHFHRT